MTAHRTGYGWAPARTSLAGNPSDGYGGAVLALALPQWCAEAWASPTARSGTSPDSPLVAAALRRFARELYPPALGTAIRWESSIPRNVGLAGSSALIIATLRALSDLWEVPLEPPGLAALALAVEVQELGIIAGPQDRVAQAYGGLTFMDFSEHGRYEQLEPDLLPPLLIAWRPEAGGHSGDTHAILRDRHQAGEPRVVETMARLARQASEARTALREGDLGRFGETLDATLELRRGIIRLDPRCVQMVELARRFQASANYTGSGGAIVAACPNPERLQALERALRQDGCDTGLVPGHNTITSG